MEPLVRVGTMRLFMVPSLPVTVEDRPDEALAALGQIGAHDEVQLAAGAGDVLEAGGLGVHLAEQVQVHRVVDGDEVVDLADDPHVVGVVHRGGHHVRVAVHIVVQLLGAGGEGVDLAGPLSRFLWRPVILPAAAMSTKPSTYISVWTDQVLQSDWADHAPMVLGMPPMPSCRQAPLGISGTTRLATARSTSVAHRRRPAGPRGGLSPSTTKSTS